MGIGGSQPPTSPSDPSASERLDSWKEIAAYLRRDESTVRRWEKEGLPVHRHGHKKKASVYAHKPEIDAWWTNGRNRLEAGGSLNGGRGRRDALTSVVLAGLALSAVAVGLTWNVGGLRDRFFRPNSAASIRSLAVLPLANLTGDPNQDYLADGMTEALINEFAQISTLRVISRTSVIGYKKSVKPLPQIARELNVDGIVEGSVQRVEGRVGGGVELLDL